jgi:hypothetical protein
LTSNRRSGAQLRPDQLRDARSRCLVSVVRLQRGKRVAAPADGGFLVIRGVVTGRLRVGIAAARSCSAAAT